MPPTLGNKMGAMTTKTGKTPTKIMAIETIRGFSALYVFVGHTVLSVANPQGILAWPFKFGGEAVMLFFLISGFSVSLSVLNKPGINFQYYFTKRWIRIYPIFILALLIGYFCSSYNRFMPLTLIGNLLMLQEYGLSRPGVLFDTYHNPALWSLSYEWWFYMLFWMTIKLIPPPSRLLFVTLGGTIFSALYEFFAFQPFLFAGYFPLWWWGAEIAVSIHAGNRLPPKTLLAHAAFTVAVFGILAVIGVWNGEPASIAHHPVLEFRQSCVTFLFIAAIYAIGWDRFLTIGRFGFFSKFIAPISYGIYALHFPIVIFVMQFRLPIPTQLALDTALVLMAALIAERCFQAWVNNKSLGWIRREESRAPTAVD